MRTGLDCLEPGLLAGRKVGLLTHYAAARRDYRASVEVIAGMDGVKLAAILAPQHGFWGETQDNMIEWQDYTHPELGIPVHSLYSHRRIPDRDILDLLDCLVVDLQDVGARYYTYVYSMAFCMRECAAANVDVVILDRPNPLGFSIIEGRRLEEGFESFVGMYPIPVRHGLTIGELARLFASIDGLPEPLVLKLEDWDGKGMPEGYPWIYPSPNMPSPDTALVYPGMCLLEATNLSEGRGTTLPFQVFGAPWLNAADLVDRLNGTIWTPGSILRRHAFIPTFNKHCGEICHGAQIHVTDPAEFRPLRTAVGILMVAFEISSTKWNDPPYEYEYNLMPADILAGGAWLRESISRGDEEGLLLGSLGDASEHLDTVSDSLLYRRDFTS